MSIDKLYVKQPYLLSSEASLLSSLLNQAVCIVHPPESLLSLFGSHFAFSTALIKVALRPWTWEIIYW